jgi:Ca2+-binding EF-hand superfamily protein
MHRHNYNVSDDELILLLNRLDKNRDGLISQDEVILV